jgi:hypothetical protein
MCSIIEAPRGERTQPCATHDAAANGSSRTSPTRPDRAAALDPFSPRGATSNALLDQAVSRSAAPVLLVRAPAPSTIVRGNGLARSERTIKNLPSETWCRKQPTTTLFWLPNWRPASQSDLGQFRAGGKKIPPPSSRCTEERNCAAANAAQFDIGPPRVIASRSRLRFETSSVQTASRASPRRNVVSEKSELPPANRRNAGPIDGSPPGGKPAGKHQNTCCGPGRAW